MSSDKKNINVLLFKIVLSVATGILISTIINYFLFKPFRYESQCYYQEFIEKIPISSKIEKYHGINGEFYVYKGKVDEDIYYSFYLTDDGGRKLLVKENAESTFLYDNYIGEPYVEIVWNIKMHEDKMLENNNQQERYLSYSEYAKYGTIKMISIYTNSGTVEED